MKKTVLLVEDSKVQKMANARVLYRAGYLLLFADEGEEALRLVRESLPDLVLLDLILPGMGGEEVLGTLKRDPHTRHIPVIILTNVGTTESAKWKAAGAADYYEKSRLLNESGEDEFLKTIERVLLESEGQNASRGPMPAVAALDESGLRASKSSRAVRSG